MSLEEEVLQADTQSSQTANQQTRGVEGLVAGKASETDARLGYLVERLGLRGIGKAIFTILYQKQPRILTLADITRYAWGEAHVNNAAFKSLRVHKHNIESKLRNAGLEGEIGIMTHYGIGYHLEDLAAPAVTDWTWNKPPHQASDALEICNILAANQVPVTPKEAKLLLILLQGSRKALSIEELAQQIYRKINGKTLLSVRWHASNLADKIEGAALFGFTYSLEVITGAANKHKITHYKMQIAPAGDRASPAPRTGTPAYS